MGRAVFDPIALIEAFYTQTGRELIQMFAATRAGAAPADDPSDP